MKTPTLTESKGGMAVVVLASRLRTSLMAYAAYFLPGWRKDEGISFARMVDCSK